MAAEKRGLGRLHRSEDQTKKVVLLPNNPDSFAGRRAIKRMAASMLQVAANRAKELLARAKSHSAVRTIGQRVSDSSVGGEYVSDLLKIDFLSSPSVCAKLVDQVYQVGDLNTVSSFSLDKQKETTMCHLQNRMIFYGRVMQNSSVVGLSSALVDELVKKNTDLTNKLSTDQIHHDARISEMKETMPALKSSVSQKDSELKPLMFCSNARKHTFTSNVSMLLWPSKYNDELLVKFDTNAEAMEASKHEIVANTYKLGYLDCRNGVSSYCSLEDEVMSNFILTCPCSK